MINLDEEYLIVEAWERIVLLDSKSPGKFYKSFSFVSASLGLDLGVEESSVTNIIDSLKTYLLEIKSVSNQSLLELNLKEIRDFLLNLFSPKFNFDFLWIILIETIKCFVSLEDESRTESAFFNLYNRLGLDSV